MDVVVDMNCLAYRAYYTTGGLSTEDKETGVMYGVLRELKILFKTLGPDRLVLCFDSRHSLRKDLFSGYKQRPSNAEAIKQKAKEAVGTQLTIIRKYINKNKRGTKTLMFKGYEADDCIAYAVDQLLSPEYRAKHPTIIIVSADKDLYQLLDRKVTVYNPIAKTYFTKQSFVAKYKFQPCKWIKLKALAGCPSDKIPGIGGVGEKTAIDFLSGKLDAKKKDKLQQKMADNHKAYQRNIRLVTLPFDRGFSFSENDPFRSDKQLKWNWTIKPSWSEFIPLVRKFKMNSLLERTV